MLKSILRRIFPLRKIAGDRRESPRHQTQRKARLVFNVSVVSTDAATGKSHMIPLEGITRDISETGLGLIVPSVRVGDRYLIDKDCTLRVVLLDLPRGEVEIYAAPVRYQILEESEEGHLIGVRITSMSENDRERLLEYLKTLS